MRSYRVRSAASWSVEVVFYLNVSWLLVNDYILRLISYSLQSQESWFDSSGFVEEIAAGNAVEPYRTRLLVPWIVVGLNNLDDLTLNVLGVAQFQRLFYVLSFALLMLLIRLMLTSLGYGKGVGLAGAFLTAALLSIALREHVYQAWSWLEGVTFALAVILSLRLQKMLPFVLLVVAASLNRETAIFIPLIPLAVAIARWRTSQRWRLIRLAVVGIVAAVVVRIGLMFVWPGPTTERTIAIETIREWNQQLPRLTIENLSIFLGGLIVATIIALLLRNPPRESVWIAALTVPPLVSVWLYYSLWWEVRVLLPVFILLLPIALSAVVGRPLTPLRNETSVGAVSKDSEVWGQPANNDQDDPSHR